MRAGSLRGPLTCDCSPPGGRMLAAVGLATVRLFMLIALMSLVVLMALMAPPAHAAPAGPGQPLAPLATTDQHDRPLRVDASTRLLIFAADKAASDLVIEALRPHGAKVLASRQAVFIADIHAMPALITRMFALPALRELPFAIGLVRDAALTADLPRQKGQATLITLNDGVVQAVRQLSRPAEVSRALALPER